MLGKINTLITGALFSVYWESEKVMGLTLRMEDKMKLFLSKYY
jgi:hypothetical protein